MKRITTYVTPFGDIDVFDGADAFLPDRMPIMAISNDNVRTPQRVNQEHIARTLANMNAAWDEALEIMPQAKVAALLDITQEALLRAQKRYFYQYLAGGDA
jgi:hypothetical protein